ncbi:N-acetylmuramic acid 6-phosphate etherase [Demetria terragena]|uniref:N-acetylmuramic acid 6-phosphate etherase n=1 Tax=Demetria terragena TaxID=63959 RepID=UPI0003736D55|nr:N-acetylmuramic acid 6-phosphate etherase [Demetria terragena]
MSTEPLTDSLRVAHLGTEARHPESTHLDELSVPDVLALMNEADATVPTVVRGALPEIARAVELVAASLERGGRLIYVGAGTSGRLALLDAAECPPTFSTDPSQVIALLAGGQVAFTRAVEGAEDDTEQPSRDLDGAALAPEDTVVGLSASGRTPYVIAALDHARARGAHTVSVSCNADAEASEHADVAIELPTGAEILTGSTRLKAGTAQKMVCNMLTTAAMVRRGKVFENLMVDMSATNGKLQDRARRIVAEAAKVDKATASAALTDADGEPKVAIVALLTGTSTSAARRRLGEAGGQVARAVEN